MNTLNNLVINVRINCLTSFYKLLFNVDIITMVFFDCPSWFF